jgi:hypothetical protein
MRLWFDTNALWRKLSELRALSELARAKGVTPLASAQVYLEDRRRTRVARGPKFLAEDFDAGFAQLFQIIDVPFERVTAARWADLLATRYPSREAWRGACHATLGGRLREEFAELPARIPMTTDWWVALAVEDDAASRVVCDERSGEEWRALRESGRVLTWSESQAWLEGLPSVPG